MKEIRFAYVAGLLDADGCLGISRSLRKDGYVSYDPTIRVRSTHLLTVKWLVKTFGGTFSKTSWDNDCWKDYYTWKFSSDVHARRFLVKVSKYLWLKKKQANLLEKYYSLDGKVCPPEREGLYSEMKKLNEENPSRLTRQGYHFSKLHSAYLAGSFDGEGSIYIIKVKQSRSNGFYYRATITFSNTYKSLVVSFKSLFGGCWRKRKPHNGVLPMFQLDIQDNSSKERALLYMLPYLITKKEQAKLALNFIRIKGNNPLLRRELMRRCCSLNGR